MGAALSSNASESSKFAIDDKISKLKEHWESVSLKFRSQKKWYQDMMEQWGTYEDLRRQLIQWVQSADGYYADAGSKEPGSTVTELEEQLMQHKVCALYLLHLHRILWYVYCILWYVHCILWYMITMSK